MTINRKTILKEFRDLCLFALIGFLQTFLTCMNCSPFAFRHIVLFSILMWWFLYKGNEFVGYLVSLRISWLEQPVMRMVVGFVATMAYTIGIVVLLMLLFEYLFHFDFGTSFHWTIKFTVVLTLLISLALHSYSFLGSWRQAAIRAGQLEKENITARYESLKNQVNPHFLFNSLNALTSLVYEDQEKAVKFIKQLSDVYRYVLENRDKELVPLTDELQFLSSYLFLEKIRFGEKLSIDITLNNVQTMLPPLALQMLVENAIKHNEVSTAFPLTIRLYVADGNIVVENKIQHKQRMADDSQGVGLENIRKRYEFLSDKPVVITDNGETFTVQLPLLS